MYRTDGRNLQHLTLWPICATQSPRVARKQEQELNLVTVNTKEIVSYKLIHSYLIKGQLISEGNFGVFKSPTGPLPYFDTL